MNLSPLKTSRVLVGFLLSLATACSPNQIHNTYNSTNTANPSNGASPLNHAPNIVGGGGGGGTGDGGGGQGILCSTEVRDPNLKDRLFVRDIFEVISSKKNMPLKNINSNPSNKSEVTDEALYILVKSLQNYYGPASSNLEFTKIETWKNLNNNKILTDQELVISKDANSPIVPPKGCEVVQIAYWTELKGASNSGTLTINQDYWEKLDQLNKVALLAHEYFYAQARLSGYENSDFVRDQVGHLFLTSGLDPLFKNWNPSQDSRVSNILPANKTGFKYCEGRSDEDTTAYMQLYQYEGSDNQQHFVFPIIKSSLINFSVLQRLTYDFNRNENPSLYNATELFLAIENGKLREEIPDFPEVDNRRGPMSPKVLPQQDESNLSESTIYSDIPTPEDLKRFNRDIDDNTTRIESLITPDIPIVWQRFVQAANKSIQITIHNPGLNYKRAYQKPKKIDELITIANQQIITNLKSLIGATYEPVPIEILNSINLTLGALQTDINNLLTKTHIKKTTNAEENLNIIPFPTWDAALKKLAEAELAKHQDTLVRLNSLAMFIYLAKINAINSVDIAHALGESGFDDPQTNFEKIKGQISFKTESGVLLKMDLTCNDYNSIFRVNTATNIKLELPRNIKTNPNMKLEYVRHVEEYDDFFMKRANYLMKVLSSSDGLDIPKDYLSDPKDKALLLFGNKVCKKTGPCGDETRRFLENLQTEKQIKIKSCNKIYYDSANGVQHSTNLIQDNPNETKFCYIFSFPNTNTKYVAKLDLSSQGTKVHSTKHRSYQEVYLHPIDLTLEKPEPLVVTIEDLSRIP